MKNFILTSNEIEELRAAHRAALKIKGSKSAYRINSVILLGSGWTLAEVSEALLLDDETLRNYAYRYQQAGLNGLLKTAYKGRQKKLSDEELSMLCEELDSTIYLNTKEICSYIEKTFGKKYTASGITDLLRSLGYVYKKPKLSPGLADSDAQDIFLEQFVRFMKDKKETDAVFFVDAVHPIHNSIAGYGWIKKGVEKNLKTNTGRTRLNIHGAMNAETYETTIISSESNVNTDSTIDLLGYLEEIYPLATTIYIILDNAKYHYSKEVQEWLKTSRVKLVFLPPYSPELNLIERLWRVFKKKILYNQFYEKYSDFKSACLGFFEKQDKHHDEISSIMGAGLEALI